MLYVIGIGPGEENSMTFKAVDALKSCDIIVGYGLYIDLIKNIVHDKKIITTPMKGEVERCKLAVEAATLGNNVAVISSGDAGIYGMAGLVYEIAAEYEGNGVNIQIEVIPGITAASSAAAVLGAPLTCDFSVISLSDLLTPWFVIEKRLRSAIQGDFVVCLYNPASLKRADYLERACNIALEYIDGGTWCGYVRNIGRKGQESSVLTLKDLASFPADMFTTVIIGNSLTKLVGGKLVTPRGYKIEEK